MKIVKLTSAHENFNFPNVMDVSPEEVWEKKNELHLIDVRGKDEYTGELGHVPGSKLIVLDTLINEINDLPKDKPIVFICRSGARSARATQLAKEAGFHETYNMAGGMLAWNARNMITEK